MTTLESEVGRFVADANCIVGPKSPLREVARAIAESDQTLALVIDEGRVAGVVSEGDIVRALRDGADLDQVWAADVMTAELVTVSSRSSLRDAIDTMLGAKTHQVLVLDDDVVPGIVSLAEAVTEAATSKEWAR